MTTSQLVPVTPGTIGNVQCLTVDGRALHGVLGVRRDFSTWMKSRITKYGFVEGQDFEVFAKSGENSEFDSPDLGNQKNRGGDRRSQEYSCALDMGKELCMVENNEQGRVARRYFIECERHLLADTAATQAAPDRLSTRKDPERKELTAAINAWVGCAPVHYAGARNIINAHFGVDSVDKLTVAQVKEAVALVYARIAETRQTRTQQDASRPSLPVGFDRAAELGRLYDEVLTRALDIERWIDRLDSQLSGLLGPVMIEATRKLAEGSGLICTDRGINLLHMPRRTAMDGLRSNLRELSSIIWFSAWFAKAVQD